MPKRITITVTDKSNTGADLIEVARILYHLQHYTKQWQKHFGYANKEARDRWQATADKWLSENVLIEDSNEG